MSDEKQSVIPLAPTREPSLLDTIAEISRDPGADVGKLERLIALYERVQDRQAHAAYTAALALLLPELPEIVKKGGITDKQGNIQSKYAKWEDMQAAIKPVLAKHGFALTFRIGQEEGKLAVTGVLSHSGGHVEETTMLLPLDTTGSKNSVQAHGSSVSYGQRYTAIALLNLTSRGTDDDGVAGGTAYISEGQVEVLRLLARQAKIKLDSFCVWLKVASLDQLPAHRFGFAEQALKERLPPKPAEPKT